MQYALMHLKQHSAAASAPPPPPPPHTHPVHSSPFLQNKLSGDALGAEVESQMEAMDTNKDDKVSPDEFLEHMRWVGQKTESDAEFAALVARTYNISVSMKKDAEGAVSCISPISQCHMCCSRRLYLDTSPQSVRSLRKGSPGKPNAV